MKNIKFNGFEKHPNPNKYNGPSGKWVKGDVKSLEDAEADRLLKDFPEAFSEEKAPEPAPKKGKNQPPTE